MVRDSAGEDVLRMVENGNVLLMTKDAEVHEGVTDWSGVFQSGAPAFILQQPAQQGVPQYQAVLTTFTIDEKTTWHLYLRGQVAESVEDLAGPDSGHTAFMVKNKDGQVMALIDDQGNLKMRGYLLIDGIPRSVKQYEATDAYLPTYQ